MMSLVMMQTLICVRETYCYMINIYMKIISHCVIMIFVNSLGAQHRFRKSPHMHVHDAPNYNFTFAYIAITPFYSGLKQMSYDF